MGLDRSAALRREIDEVTRFCRELDGAAWQTPSGVSGWRVQDVVAHLSANCRAIFTPASLKLLTSKDIERTNDELVDKRRQWPSARVLAEFERWGRRLAALSGVLSRTPAARVPMPLGELGSFPAAVLLNSAFVFDQHTHLRFDIAPALGRPVPDSDELRTAVLLEWMFAVLANQLRKARPEWLDRPVGIRLRGPGGGYWRIGADGAVTPTESAGGAATVTGTASEFPGWGTARVPWRQRDVTITGDEQLATKLLDALNIV